MSEHFEYEQEECADPLELIKEEAYRQGYEAALGDMRRRVVHEIDVYTDKIPELDYSNFDDITSIVYDAYNALKKMVNS
jgi:uncharacterized protein YllA (UPF0747 family)